MSRGVVPLSILMAFLIPGLCVQSGCAQLSRQDRTRLRSLPDHSRVRTQNLERRELLHTKKRQDDTCERLSAVLGESCISCELQLIESFQQGFSSLPPAIADELFRPEISEGDVGSLAVSPDISKLKKVNVVMDNSLSPSQTLLQIHCVDQKGLLYDIMRTLKDCSIQLMPDCAPHSVAYILELLGSRYCADCHIYRVEGRGRSWDPKGNHIADDKFVSGGFSFHDQHRD